jgi:hypothetical protein
MKRVDLNVYTRERFGLSLYDFLRQKTEKEALYDYEIARILGVSRGRIGHLRRSLGINRKNAFAGRFERRYGKGAVTQFTNLIENPENSLADTGNHFGFSREYARQVYREIQGCPYTMAYRKRREKRARKKAAFSPPEQSVERTVEHKFRGLRGINCRLDLGAPSAVSLEIKQIISRRLSDSTNPSSRSESIRSSKE